MSLDLCFEVYFSKFKIYDLIKENRESIIKLSKLYEGVIEIKDIVNEEKNNYFIISRLFTKSFFFINQILSDYNNNVTKVIQIKKLFIEFSMANVEIGLSEGEFRKIVRSVLIMHDEENVELESIINFLKRKYNLKVNVLDFLEISLNSFITTNEILEKKAIQIFDKIDYLNNEIFTYKEFILASTMILGVSQNEWKLNEYFK